MTKKEEVHYLSMALNIAGIYCNDMGAELIIEIQKGLKKKAGKFSVEDAIRIKCGIEAKYTKPSPPKE